MGHYDRDNTHRCEDCKDKYQNNPNGRLDPELGPPEVSSSSVDVVLRDGIPMARFKWTEKRRCQRKREKHSRYGDNPMRQCQVTRTKNRSRIIPIADLGERLK